MNESTMKSINRAAKRQYITIQPVFIDNLKLGSTNRTASGSIAYVPKIALTKKTPY
jgi:hypothetical protein